MNPAQGSLKTEASMASGFEVNIQHVMALSLEGLKRAQNLTRRMAWPFIESFLRACVPSLHLHSSVTEAAQQAMALTRSYLMITVVPTTLHQLFD